MIALARALRGPALWVGLALASALPPGGALAAGPAAGSSVEGHVGSAWIPCTVVGDQLPTDGYVLHCAGLADDNVFSASDVRQTAAPPPARRPGRALVAPPPIQPPAAATAAAATRPVQGLIRGVWQDCLAIGPALPTGGQVLRCPSLPDDSVFSASEVRGRGGAPAAALAAAPAAAPAGRAVQGLIRGVWQACTQIGDQLPTGGYLLRCPSLPGDSVFSASEVRR